MTSTSNMTGRDLILYIIQNGLEDDPVFDNGRFIGFLTDIQTAVKFGVGVNTVRAWVQTGVLDGICIANTLFIPANAQNPKVIEKRKKQVEEKVNEKEVKNPSDVSNDRGTPPRNTCNSKPPVKGLFAGSGKHRILN